MPKTLTGNNPRREQRLQQLMLDRIEQKYVRRVAWEVNRAMREAAKLVDAGEPVPTDQILPEHRKRMSRLLDQLWMDSGMDMSEHIAGTKKAMASFETKRTFDAVQPTEQADRVMQDWILSVGAAKIVRISETTKRDVKRIINKGIREGLSEKEIAKLIRESSPSLANNRAQLIARTETHTAANVAAQATAEASGVQLQREWVANMGSERTRVSHREADGQKVGMKEPFIVDGVPLMYPGDPEGPARLTINCRCAVAYVVK